MSTGPEHYKAAEGLLFRAQSGREQSHDPDYADQAAQMLDDAELDMKAAHVHAMLAVAAATAGRRTVGRSVGGGGVTYVNPPTGWDSITDPERSPKFRQGVQPRG